MFRAINVIVWGMILAPALCAGSLESCDPSDAAVAKAAEYLIGRDNAGDLEGVLDGYTSDIIWYPPDGPPLEGINAIRPRYEKLFSGFTVSMRSNILEANGDGEKGFVFGATQGTLTPLDGGPVVEVDDRFAAITRCVKGRWRVSRLFWAPR